MSQVRLGDFQEGMWVGLCDLGQVVGSSGCVRVSPEDKVVYARRQGRTGWTRFIKGRQGEPCSHLKLVLRWCAEPQCVVLRTAFVGGDTPPEPWSSGARVSPEALERSRAFWAEHALIWDEASLEPGSPVLPAEPPEYRGDFFG